MFNLTCIVCPIGCALEIKNDGTEDNLTVTGNRCARGTAYAIEEIKSPKRVVTATAFICPDTIKSEVSSIRRVPVKTSVPCPREKIPALLQDIYKLKVSLPIELGDVLINNWNGEGIDIVTTRRIS